MICPHILDWPVGSGEPLLLDGFEWCMAHIALGWTCQREICCQSNCPFDFGEWGAWRSCSREVTMVAVWVANAQYEEDDWEALGWAMCIEEVLDAVGWSS